ncbi:MAG TPA: hypothetical protein PK513_03550 [Alphaproteobacteria bacterium]|nr:hypothetical protein [Alphaproteobacteria bacterium]
MSILVYAAQASAHSSSKSHNHKSSQSAPEQLSCKASKPSLSVKTATTRTKYIRTKSSKDLTQLHGGGGSSVGGLGGGEIGFKTEGKFEITEAGGKACVKLKQLEVTFYAKPEIHIASNFNRSTCEHNAVMAHEKGHIRILRKFVREFSPKVKVFLSKYVYKIDPAIGPIPKSQVNEAQKKIQEQYMSKLEAYQNKIMPILGKRQKAHDSPQEYARVASKCSKWDKKLAQ